MTIGPTVAGGLKLVPESESDWMLLLGIAGDSDANLAGRLSSLMDEDSMWEEIVEPELKEAFSRQRLAVVKAVMEAKRADEDVHIVKESADDWYGALNQARLNLEEEFRFGPRELNDPSEMEDATARAAYYRNDFYCQVQSLLLRYVMTD